MMTINNVPATRLGTNTSPTVPETPDKPQPVIAPPHIVPDIDKPVPETDPCIDPGVCPVTYPPIEPDEAALSSACPAVVNEGGSLRPVVNLSNQGSHQNILFSKQHSNTHKYFT